MSTPHTVHTVHVSAATGRADRRLVVGIANATWDPRRKPALERLVEQLRAQGIEPHVSESHERETAYVWALRLWRWAAAQDADAILLNDDVEVCPVLLQAVDAILDVPTSGLVSLHITNPSARGVAHAGDRWLRTYHLTGPAYLVRRGTAPSLVRWWTETKPQEFVRTINEDNAAIYHAFRLREPIWNAIPALVTHDVTIPSTLNYEDHPQRRTPVPWSDPLFSRHDLTKGWEPKGKDAPAFVETSWMHTSALKTTEISLTLGLDPITCMFCGKRPMSFGSAITGIRMCFHCLRDATAGFMNSSADAAAEKMAAEVAKEKAAQAQARPTP